MELDFSTIRKKVHSPEEGEQLGLPLDFSTIRQDPDPGILPPQGSIGDHHPQLSQLSQLSQPPQSFERPSPHPPITQDVIRDFIPAVKYGENTLQLNKAIGDLSQREYVEENPVEAGLETLFTILTGGLPKQAKTDEQLAALEQEVAERSEVQEAQRVIGTKDVDGVGDAVDLVAANIGASGSAMLRSILSGGTMTPDIMSNEINANLADMKDLSSKDRRALSKGGGMIAATLENLGLKWIIKGIPPGVFAKMGLKKTAELIEKSVIAKSLVKGGTATITEASTEGGQEATGIAAEIIAGKKFQPGEIYERIIEAFKLGGITGGAMSTGGTATIEGGSKLLDSVTPNTGFSLDDPLKEDDGLSNPNVEWLKRKAAEDKAALQKLPELPSKVAEKKFAKKLRDVTPIRNTDDAADAYLDYTTGLDFSTIRKEVKKPLGVRKKGGDPQVEEEVKPVETAVPEESSESQSTPVKKEEVSPTQTEQPTVDKDVKSQNYVLNSVPQAEAAEDQGRVEQGRVIDLTEEELKEQAKTSKQVIKKAKELGIDPAPLKNDVKAIQNELKRRKQFADDIEAEIKDLPPKEKDTTEQAGTEEDTSVDAEEETTPEEVTAVETKEKEVDIYDVNTRMPVKSLYTKRYADRIEYLEEEFPDGMNWDDYREDLQEIKQEQLDDRDSDKDVDDFADALDTRAVTNFTKAVKKGAKQPTPTQEELAKRIEDETEDIDPDDDLEERVYSEGDTPTGLSIDEVKSEIEGSFGKETIRKLTKNDGVVILATQKELEAEVGDSPSMEGRKIAGAFDPSTGKAFLVAENIGKDKAAGTLLHEVGEHAALNDMLGDVQYEALSNNFDELVKAKDPIALAAQKRIPKQTPPSKVKGEQLAYLVQEVQNELSKGGQVTSKTRTLYNRIINLIRKWISKLPSYRKFEGRAALKRLQKGELLTPKNIASLARVAVDYQATTDKKSFKKDITQFSEEGTRVTTTGEEIQFSEAEQETTTDDFTEVEARFEKAKVKAKKKSPFTSIKEAAAKAKNSFTRSHVDLDPKKYAQTLEYLRQVQEVSQYSQWQTFQDIYGFVDKLTDAELELFTYNIILPDMKKDLDSGLLKKQDGELPFGYKSKAQVKRHLDKKKKEAEGTKVAEAVKKRNKVMTALKIELIDEGLLSEELRNDDAYYHHQVIQFMQMDEQFKGDFNVNAQKAGVRTKKQGWQKARTGSTKDYNTQYLDAEFAVMSMMRSQLETKRLLNKIKKQEDKSKQIKAQAKEEGVEVDELLRESEEWQNFTVWKPNPDSVWYHTYTLSDKVAQEVMAEVDATDQRISENKKALAKGEKLPKRTAELDKPWLERKKGVEVTPADLGEAMVKGKDETWIIPKELAKTLNESKKQNEWYEAASAWTLQTWKKWVLLNPERFIKYNVNNTSGDLDIATAFDIKIVAGTKKATKDLYKDHKKGELGKNLKEELAEARKLGVIDSGFAITEVDDFSRMYDKLFNARPSNMKDETWAEATEAAVEDIKNAPVKLAKGYWNTVKDYTTMRENILRLASFRYFKKRIAENPNERIYAASKSYEIDQIKDDTERAAKLARELIGDYGNISHAGQFIRQHLMPFWSWTEINTPRYVRLLANSAKETSGDKKALAKRLTKVAGGKAVRTGMKAGYSLGKFAAFTTLVGIWNHTFFPEEEEKLSEFERGQLHIILGDIFGTGEVVSLRASGAFSDALSWLSLHDTFSDYQQGKTVGEQWEEMWKAPIQKVAAGLTPFPKLFYETIAGESFWPDVFNPRPTRDRWQHIAKAFSAGKIYDWAFDKPSRGWGKNLAKLLLASTDPGESAYYKVRKMVREFNSRNGDVSFGGGNPTDKGNALYYYKQALRFQDFEKAEKYLNDYKRLGGTPKGLKASIKRVSPVAGVKKKEIREFKSTLSDAEKKTIRVALDWYKKIYKGK